MPGVESSLVPNHLILVSFGLLMKAYTANGLIGLLRPPHMHVAPPLVITEDELLEGFDKQDKALYTLDEALGF